MKKLFILLLSVIMVLSLAACGGNSEHQESEEEKGGYEVNPALTATNTEGKTKLTLAALTLMPNIEERIIAFNNTNEEYYIEVLDYSQYNTKDDYSAGQTKLNTDIMSGNTPDMIELGKTPIEIYTNKGLLEDLNTFLENDDTLSKESFVSGIYNALSTQDKLYRITPTITMIGLYGTESVLGEQTGWTISEAKKFLEETDIPATPFINMPPLQILSSLTMYSLDNYINRAEGSANFDSEEFISLLEIVKRFGGASQAEYVEPDVSLAEGNGVLATTYIGSVEQFARSYDYLNGDMKMIGFPTADRSGNIADFMFSFGMFSDSEQKDGCWQFMKSFLDEEYQKTQSEYEIPVLQAVFDEALETAEGSEDTKKAYVDVISGLTKSSDFDGTIMNMINEEVDQFMEGTCTAQEAAAAIQSKVSIYLSENK